MSTSPMRLFYKVLTLTVATLTPDPSSLASEPLIELSADYGVVTENGFVTTWENRNGSGTNLTTETGAEHLVTIGPASSYRFPSGLPGVDFSGGNLQMNLERDLDEALLDFSPGGEAENSSGFAALIAFRDDPESVTEPRGMWSDVFGNSSSVKRGLILRYSEIDGVIVASLGDRNLLLGRSVVTDGATVIAGVNYDAKTETLTLSFRSSNGIAGIKTRVVPRTDFSVAGLSLGGTQRNDRYFDGAIGALRVYSRSLTAMELESGMTELEMTFNPPSTGLGGRRDYEYIGVDGNPHPIEVYSPEGHSRANELPCFVFFHGGGWDAGNLAQGRALCDYLAERGMVALTADYTLTPRSEFRPPESRKRHAVIDAKSVVRWVKANASDLGVDPERLVCGGVSAGGHISVLQMMDESLTNPSDDRTISTEVQAFVLLTAAFTRLEEDPTPEVNVFNHLDKRFPPTLFISGELDHWESASHALARELVKRNQTVEYWIGIKAGHNFILSQNGIIPTYLRIDSFLRNLGFLKGDPGLRSREDDTKLWLALQNGQVSAGIRPPEFR